MGGGPKVGARLPRRTRRARLSLPRPRRVRGDVPEQPVLLGGADGLQQVAVRSI